MSWFNIFKRKTEPLPPPQAAPVASPATLASEHSNEFTDLVVRRFFFNLRGFQTYASFFQHWDGWVTAGHCLTEAGHLHPDFASGPEICSPGGLDAALLGCTLPERCPAAPYPDQDVSCIGFPAGSSTAAQRHGKVYIERPGLTGQWIAHIMTPDEPVVSGMSGGAVIDRQSGTPIGIIITRNSPADLNNDRDPDESCDFIALSDVWRAAKMHMQLS